MTVAVLIFSFFVSHGAQPFQAEALVKHAKAESRLSPDPKHTGLGHCLYQWTGARWRQLQRSGGGGCPAIERQLQFALAELRHPTYSCFWAAPADRAYTVLSRTFGHGARCART